MSLLPSGVRGWVSIDLRFAALLALTVTLLFLPVSVGKAGLVGYWALDDGSGQTASDASGKGNVGQLGSTSRIDNNDPAWTSGKIGGGLRFDGSGGSSTTNDWLDCGNKSSLAMGTGDFTYSLWFQGTPPNWRWLLCQDGRNGLVFSTWKAKSTADGHVVRFSMGEWFHDVAQGVTEITDDTGWHQVTLVRDAGTVSSYLDGVFESSTTDDHSRSSLGITNHLYVGRYGDNGFTGVIDDVGVWDEALSAKRIAAMVGLGDFAGVGLADSGIDAVLALSAEGDSATVGGREWFYTTEFPNPEGVSLAVGSHYEAGGQYYIILDGNAADGFRGVATVPETGSLLLMVAGIAGLFLPLARRARRR